MIPHLYQRRPPAAHHDVPLVPDLLPEQPRLDRLQAVIFDVEGTLVDSVLPTLCSWQDALSDHGYCFTTAELHRWSGLGADDLLAAVLPPDVPDAERRSIAVRQHEVYRAKYLGRVTAFTGVGGLLRELAAAGLRIALAATCDRRLLNHYLSLMDCPAKAVDVIVCGRRAVPTRPHPRALDVALERLSLPASHHVVAVGDTPLDAQAALRAGLMPVGVMTGYFSRATLHAAGCRDIFEDAASLLRRLIAATDSREPTPSA